MTPLPTRLHDDLFILLFKYVTESRPDLGFMARKSLCEEIIESINPPAARVAKAEYVKWPDLCAQYAFMSPRALRALLRRQNVSGKAYGRYGRGRAYRLDAVQAAIIAEEAYF